MKPGEWRCRTAEITESMQRSSTKINGNIAANSCTEGVSVRAKVFDQGRKTPDVSAKDAAEYVDNSVISLWN
jgi:hypothetical protein